MLYITFFLTKAVHPWCVFTQMRNAKKFLCKCSVWTTTMFTKTSRDWDLFLAMDQIELKVINVDYSVKMGYWEIMCKNRKSMPQWDKCSIRISWTTCNKLSVTIYGQPNWRITTIKYVYYTKQHICWGQTV